MEFSLRDYFIGMGVTIGLTIITPYLGGDKLIKVPRTNKVEHGFVIPNKLEIELEDLDGNGTPETILEYEGKRFLFKYDGDKPSIAPYRILIESPKWSRSNSLLIGKPVFWVPIKLFTIF